MMKVNDEPHAHFGSAGQGNNSAMYPFAVLQKLKQCGAYKERVTQVRQH
jgi:hypothetical protein